jgi:hypothetical protein
VSSYDSYLTDGIGSLADLLPVRVPTTFIKETRAAAGASGFLIVCASFYGFVNSSEGDGRIITEEIIVNILKELLTST